MILYNNKKEWFGKFISIEECEIIMAPLFTENQEESLKKSGKLITWEEDRFVDIKEDINILNKESQDRLWKIGLDLCSDEKTTQIAKRTP